MQYRKLGSTGLDISVLGFGCMRLPLVGGAKLATDVFDQTKPIDEDLAGELINKAIDSGVNLFDSAYGYHGGRSEVFLGKALEARRGEVFISTKLPTWMVQGEADFDRLLGEQLDRLRTSHIDIYMMHGLNRVMWDKMKELNVFAFLDKIRDGGRVNHVGFSFHDNLDVFKEIVDGYDWEMCLIQYNYFDEKFQAGSEGLDYAAAKGMGVVAMEPLRGGRLTGNIPPEIQSVWDGADIKRTPAEWALRWVWNHQAVSSTLSGMNSDEQLTENLEIAESAEADSLDKKELELIGKVREEYHKMLKINCTNCAYCMPCPSGVNVPMNFSLYNDTFMFKDPEISLMLYNHMLAPGVKASNCDECGKCEERCPQQIEIMKELKNVHEHLAR